MELRLNDINMNQNSSHEVFLAMEKRIFEVMLRKYYDYEVLFLEKEIYLAILGNPNETPP